MVLGAMTFISNTNTTFAGQTLSDTSIINLKPKKPSTSRHCSRNKGIPRAENPAGGGGLIIGVESANVAMLAVFFFSLKFTGFITLPTVCPLLRRDRPYLVTPPAEGGAVCCGLGSPTMSYFAEKTKGGKTSVTQIFNLYLFVFL